MPTYTYAFSGGVDAVVGWGDRWNITFGGTWALFSEYWSIAVGSDSGDFTWGVGFLHGLTPTVCMPFKDRVFAGLTSQFNWCDEIDPLGISGPVGPTEWEEQAPGAGFQIFLSDFGSQDIVVGLAQLQGRLAVLGRRSIQLWQTDSDPNNFQLIQVMDNIGAVAPRPIQQIGDFDVIFVDDTGIRSLRTREVTLNAYSDDVGAPIDTILQPILATLTATDKQRMCSIVEPLTKNYWMHLRGVIYVLSRHPSSKISAWSEYEPKGSDGVLFTPTHMVVSNGQVYLRSFERGFYRYGGSAGVAYDQYSPVTMQTPYLDDKKPGILKQFAGLSIVKEGKWTISISADPQSNNFVPFLENHGSASAPDVLTDSTYDIGNIESPLRGTHFALKAVSANTSTTLPAILSSFLLFYNTGEPTG